jgi:hypothetical protein
VITNRACRFRGFRLNLTYCAAPGTYTFANGGYPVSADNLCHQAILMDHASGAVVPPDEKAVRACDAIRQRAERRGPLQGAVRPVGVIATRGRTW